MKAIQWLAGFGLLATVIAGGAAVILEPELKVQGNLSGKLTEVDNRELVLLFSEDMVPLGGQRDPQTLLRIAPAIAGEFTWRGTRTLAFRPENRWAYSTRYSVEIPAGVAALDGKSKTRGKRWSFSTPPPRPVSVGRFEENGQWQEIREGKVLYEPLWVADPLIVVFDQPVTLAGLRSFLEVRSEPDNRSAAFTLAQINPTTVRIAWSSPLAREARYRVEVNRGFAGAEGELGRDQDFVFKFVTVPRFRVEPRFFDFTADTTRFQVRFSNPLGKIGLSAIGLSVIRAGQESVLPCHVDALSEGNEWLWVRLEEGQRLTAGDSIRVKVGEPVTNGWGEALTPPFDQVYLIGSSPWPRVTSEFVGNNLKVDWKSMSHLSLHLYKLRNDFLDQTAAPGRGILTSRELPFARHWLEREVVKTWAPSSDGPGSRKFDLAKEVGGETGFFAVRLERARPFNVGNRWRLIDYPAGQIDTLEVVHRRHLDFLLRGTPTHQWLLAYDNRTGKPLPGIPFGIRRQGREIVLGKTGEDGLLATTTPLQGYDVVVAEGGGLGQAFDRLNIQLPQERTLRRIHLFSERGFYKPGDTVHLAGIVREYRQGVLRVPKEKRATVIVRGPDHREQGRAEVALDDLGGFRWDYQSLPDNAKGRYRFEFQFGPDQASHQVTIDYYQASTFEVAISGMAERLSRRDPFAATVSAQFLAGSPLAGEALDWGLELLEGEPPLEKITSLPEAAEFEWGLDPHLGQLDGPVKRKENLDGEGRLVVRQPLSVFAKTNRACLLRLTTTAETAEGKEVSASREALFLPGERVCGIKMARYQPSREPLQGKLLLLDETGRPAAGQVTLSLFRVSYERSRRQVLPLGVERVVSVRERGEFTLPLPGPGDYVVQAASRDASGEVTTTSASCWAWSSDAATDRDEFSVSFEKKSYRPGEQATCYFRSSRPGQAMVTLESHRVHRVFVIELAATTPFAFPVTEDLAPGVRLAVTGLFAGGETLSAQADIEVASEAKRLSVVLEAPLETKPGASLRASIQVRNVRGEGQKARLFFYAVDEGNLALSATRTPDPFDFFWRHGSYLHQLPVFSRQSRDCTRWSFRHPALDIPLGNRGVFGRILTPDGAPIAEARVTLTGKKIGKPRQTSSSANGYYYFSEVEWEGENLLSAAAPGHGLQEIRLHGYDASDLTERNLVLVPGGQDRRLDDAAGTLEDSQGGMRGGVEAPLEMMEDKMVAPAPMAMSRQMMGEGGQEAPDLAAIPLRQNFREVLCFRELETDAEGRAEVSFESSDQLSAYRLMAVAYGEDAFGSTEQRLTVTKDLFVSENLPEFARLDDQFRAGFQVSNRLTRDLTVTAAIRTEGIVLRGTGEHRFTVGAKQNRVALFDFTAGSLGEALLKCYVVGETDRDGLEKRLPVTDHLVGESQLDFDWGLELSKMVQPQQGAEQQVVRLTVAPSILRPAVAIAEKLVFYPYECLEQRTSKVFPFLALEGAIVDRLELKLDREQVKKAIGEYLAVLPEFQGDSGGFGYYRGAPWPSEYLTAYVLWSMALARDQGHAIDAQVVVRALAYLQNRELSDEAECFHQFVRIGLGQVDPVRLQKLVARRDKLSLVAQVFLLRALHARGGFAEIEQELIAGFFGRFQIEADFAYCDAALSPYRQDLPFHSSRYLTALVASALLDCGADFPLAPRVIRWLLETGPEQWHTTQTNVWILLTMARYARAFESIPATRATAEVFDERVEKTFQGSRDTLRLERPLAGRQEPFRVNARGDGPLYLTTELSYKLRLPGARSRGITVERRVYGEDGKPATSFLRGQTYQVDLLIDASKEVPYGVIDEPLASGFEVLRQDVATTRELKLFFPGVAGFDDSCWMRRENAADRLVFYAYALQGRVRVVYFIKALYSGSFTWLPTVVQGMYHPQYFGRGATVTAEVGEAPVQAPDLPK